ncbi:hypothetical protein CSE899_06323, partial [Cronobacter sakazakii E899]
RMIFQLKVIFAFRQAHGALYLPASLQSFPLLTARPCPFTQLVAGSFSVAIVELF